MSKDPYRYFRIEAGELLQGLGQGVIEFEREAPTKDLVARVLRFAHTLKGAARVVKLVAVADEAHAFEEVLAPYREGGVVVPRAEVSHLFRLLETMTALVTSIDHSPAAERRPAAQAQAPLDTVRLEVGEVDALLEGITEATVQLHALEGECAKLDRVRDLVTRLAEQLHPHRGPDGRTGGQPTQRASALADELRRDFDAIARGLSDAVGLVGSELGQVRGAANRLRLLPAASIFPALELAARDAAQSLDRPIRWTASGGAHRLDGHVLSGVRDALLHAVRNAVAHGIEPASVRTSAGKPTLGHVEVAVERRGRRIAFLCRDDGGGFDVTGLRRAAIARGVVSSSDAMALNTPHLFQLILQGGLTTTATPTAVSGRAVGLDVVRDAASRLRGEVSLSTDPGRGSTIEICVPVSLASVTALLVTASGVTASVPVDSIRGTLRLATSQIAYSAGVASIPYDGRAIPFLDLATALGQKAAQRHPREHGSVVVIESGTAMAAMGVDRLLHSEAIIMRPIPGHIEVDPVVAGISLDAEGHPQLVLDPDGVIAAARSGRVVHAAPQVTVTHPVLIIDDSLTTRMLERSILESAGYSVDLATSAEEALVKAAEAAYSLFVVDVEMPGMDGFEFVQRTRRDPAFQGIPAILVTSRGSEEDRQRGRDAGASAYIVKGEFDQNQLLGAIRDLIGDA